MIRYLVHVLQLDREIYLFARLQIIKLDNNNNNNSQIPCTELGEDVISVESGLE